jgi:hypothetical protein
MKQCWRCECNISFLEIINYKENCMGLAAGITEITSTQILRAEGVRFHYTAHRGENKSSLSTSCKNSASTNTSIMKQDISASTVPRVWSGPKD